MIYLKEGNIPLNLAWDDDIFQEANGTYQLSFKFPVTDERWSFLTTETFLLADDLHGEQEFFIFDVVKENGYVQVYANQVATLLNYYTISSLSVDRVAGQTVMNALAGAIVRKHPFSFSSDIMDYHTLNIAGKSVMEVLAKERHSILGQWGGDLVRDKYEVRLLQNGGTENESLFMYKKNLSKYHESRSVKGLRTRIHFRKKLTSQEDEGIDQVISVTVDSPLIRKYAQIYEATMDVNDQDVKDAASLREYGKRYFSSSLCDLVEDSLELEVKGESDVPVKMFDVVSVYHEQFDTDLRIKISKYHFSPMSKKLKSIGFGKISQSMGSALKGMVSDAVSESTSAFFSSFDVRLQKEIENANRAFDVKFEKERQFFEDGIEQVKSATEKGRLELAQSIEEMMSSQQAEFSRNYSEFTKGLQNQINTLVSTDQSLLNAFGEQTKTQLELTSRLREVEEAGGVLYERITQVEGRVDSTAGDVLVLSRKQTEIKKSVDEISASVSSLDLDGVLKKSEVLIENGRVQIGAGQVMDGNTVASLLTVQPEAIRAVTDKLVITSRQINLVSEKYKNTCVFVSENGYVMDAPLPIDEREFLITGEAMRVSGSGSLSFFCVVRYSDGSSTALGTVVITNGAKAPFKFTSKVTPASGKTVTGIQFCMNVKASSVWQLCNLSIVPKTSAELIVDGSITADKLNVNSVRAGVLTANSITSNMLQANAITADKMKVDTAMINKFASNEAFVNTLTAKRAFITAVQAVDLSATRIKSGVLQARNGSMTVNLDQANITFNSNATIDFKSANNALVRRKGTHTAFVHFNDVNSSSDGGVGSLYASIGVTSSGDGINSQSSGRFCGARFFRGARGTAHVATVDQAELYGDKILLSPGFDEKYVSLTFNKLSKSYELADLFRAVHALTRCWIHWNNVGWDPNSNDLRRAIINEYNNHMKDL